MAMLGKSSAQVLCCLLCGSVLSMPSLARSEPAVSVPNADGALIATSSYDPDYSGGDFTRPETNIEGRFENRRSGTQTRTDENTLTLRSDGAYRLSPV